MGIVDVVLQDEVMGAHPDTWKPWVWAMFAFNTLFGIIFAILSWATFSVSPLHTIVASLNTAVASCLYMTPLCQKRIATFNT